MPSITFLGAARTVTGSKHLFQAGKDPVLVDCGLFQGLKPLRQLNWEPLPFAPSDVRSVILTHAHIDHSGYLPRLVAKGFRGRILCTPATRDLCQLVLPDAGRLQEEDARQANKHGYTKHSPAVPLFTEADAFRALSQLLVVGFNRPFPVADGVEVEFIPAGHLLGSAFARVRVNGTSGLEVLFGGDLGRYGRPVLQDPSTVESADALVLESTYGDREHEPDDQGLALAEIVNSTVRRGGRVIIPAFAIGRVEELLYLLKKLEDTQQIPVLPVYVDSPMAVEALAFYQSNSHELDPALQQKRRAVAAFCTQRFRAVESPAKSKALVASPDPAIVVSASGMATGGRVLHHLEAALPDRRHTIVFVGFQSPGTRGRALVDGAPEVKIHGKAVRVAARIAKIESMSAHADQREILQWLGGFKRPPQTTYLVHGELRPMTALKGVIEGRLGWKVHMPEMGEQVRLGES